MAFDDTVLQNSAWLIVYGASYHIRNDRKLFSFMERRDKRMKVSHGDGSRVSCTYKGIFNIVIWNSRDNLLWRYDEYYFYNSQA